MSQLSTNSEAWQELETLQAALASRKSILHLAHAVVSILLAGIAGGAVARMFWDDASERSILAVPMAVMTGLLVCYALVRWVLGRRVLKDERRRFETLMALRRELKVDDPSQLLPS